MNERAVIIGNLIRSVRILKGLNALNDKGMSDAIAVWSDAISDIPNDHIKICYDKIIKDGSIGNWDIIVVKMNEVWGSIKEKNKHPIYKSLPVPESEKPGDEEFQSIKDILENTKPA